MHRKTALLAFVASALVVSGIAPAAAQKQTLKMAYWAGPSHHMVQTQEAWAKTIFDASGGNLVIEVDKAYSTRVVPNALQLTAGRKEAIRRTGKSDVPVLILDDDTTVAGSKAIVEWARANPAQAGAPSPKPAA